MKNGSMHDDTEARDHIHGHWKEHDIPYRSLVSRLLLYPLLQLRSIEVWFFSLSLSSH